MKRIVKLRIVILVLVIILIAISAWMNTIEIENSRTYEKWKGNMSYEYKIEYLCEVSGNTATIKCQRKDNGDTYYECENYYGSSISRIRIITIENKEYLYSDIDDLHQYSVHELENYEIVENDNNMFSEPLENDYESTRRQYEFADGKLYYVECFRALDNDEMIIKVYFNGDNIEFYTFDNEKYYIKDYSTDIDESLFELPDVEGYTNITE